METCLSRLSSASAEVQESQSVACLMLAVSAMAPEALTREGFDSNSTDTLQCTYLALAGAVHEPGGQKNTALLLSLGALLGAPHDGGAWLRRLMAYDEAPVSQARVHDKEMQLRATVQKAADATDVSDAERLLNAAEALELFGAMRHWGFQTPDEARVRKAALGLQGCEANIRDEREHELLPQLRALLTMRQSAAGRAVVEERGRETRDALYAQLQGGCSVLAASFERCVVLTSTPEFKRNPVAFVPQMKACAAENQALLNRALELSATDDCARAFLAATDNAEALFMFMALLVKGGLRDAVPYLVLPPPEGDCAHAKSPAAVRAAYDQIERNYPRDDEDGIDGDMPQRVRAATAAAQKQQQKLKQHARQAAAPSHAAPDDESRSAARGGAKLAALLLLCVAAWRVAAAAERSRRRPARDSLSRERARARAAAGVSAPR